MWRHGVLKGNLRCDVGVLRRSFSRDGEGRLEWKSMSRWLASRRAAPALRAGSSTAAGFNVVTMFGKYVFVPAGVLSRD